VLYGEKYPLLPLQANTANFILMESVFFSSGFLF